MQVGILNHELKTRNNRESWIIILSYKEWYRNNIYEYHLFFILLFVDIKKRFSFAAWIWMKMQAEETAANT